MEESTQGCGDKEFPMCVCHLRDQPVHKVSSESLLFCLRHDLVYLGMLSSFPDLDSNASSYCELVL